MAFEQQQNTAKQQIRTLLGVLLCGIACAFLVVGFGAYYYGPSGRYKVRNALIAPELAMTLIYNDTNSKTGGTSRYIFDGIQFSYYAPHEKQVKRIEIDPELYNRFYQSILSDISIDPVTAEIEGLFQKEHEASLNIKVRTESRAAWQDDTKSFQEVTFASQGDYYRIELHEEKNPNPWAYFHHPKIYQKAIQTFVPTPP